MFAKKTGDAPAVTDVVPGSSEPHILPYDLIGRRHADLTRGAERLTDISRRTESEFLEVGKRLQDFSDGCSANSALSSEIISMVEGGKGHNFNALEELFESAYTHTGACADAIARGLKEIGELKAGVKEISDLQSFLRHLSKSIHIIGVLSRIETARIDGAEFSSMTSVVDDLAGQIVKSTGEITASAKDIGAAITATSNALHAKLGEFVKRLSVSRARVSDIVLAMNTMRMKAASACRRISERAGQTMPEISGIIGLLQYHDICRQKMEHVAEAVVDMASKMEAAGEMPPREKHALIRWLPDVLTVQASQLRNVNDDTTRAVEGVSAHLSRISYLADAQTGDAGMILNEEESGSLSLGKVADELENLLAITSECREMTNEMIRAVSEVSEKIDRMSDHTSQIVLISENINLLAMNAIIRVSHTGDAGRSLGVLANRISALSKLATQEIEKGSSRISEVLTRTTGFKDTLSAVLNGQLVSADEIVRKTHLAVNELLDADKTLVKAMQKVSEVTNSLKRDIARLVSDLQFDRTITSVTGEVIAALDSAREEIAGRLSGIPAGDGNGATAFSKELEELARRYTMESERAVHNAVFNGTAAFHEPAGVGAGGRTGQSGDGLGDNIELF